MEVLLKIFIHFVINAKLTDVSRRFTYIFFQKTDFPKTDRQKSEPAKAGSL